MIVLASALALTVSASMAQAGPCTAKDQAALAKALTNKGHFSGTWKKGNFDGPFDMKFSMNGGKLVIKVNASNQHGRRTGWHTMGRTTISGNKVNFVSKQNGVIRLTIRSNCSISGRQPGGTTLSLR